MKKKLIVAGAAAALTAAAAVPAFALENEFHGMYKLKAFLSNADDGGPGQIDLSKSSRTAANYFEQRARIFYTAKANDSLKLVTGFEIDSVWGDRAQGGYKATTISGTTVNTISDGTATRNSGAALEADAVNLETKWVYLDFMVPSTPVNMKVGIQAYKDALKGIWMDCDAAGVYATAKYGAATSNIGYFRGYEGIKGGVSSPRGTDNLDIAVLEGKYALNKDLSLGGAYYLLSDYRTSLPLTYHTFGVTADAKVGPAAISGFAAYQTGYNRNASSASTLPTYTLGSNGGRISAWAANVAAKVQAGPGTARAAFLITSGDKEADGVDHSWQSLVQSVNGPNQGLTLGTYTESGMILLNRNPATGGTSSDRTIVNTMGNNGRGVTLLTAGYDATITPKTFATANVGVALTTENKIGDQNGSHYQGTEVNTEVGYKLYDNLTASVQAAYVFLGSYYDNTADNKTKDPVNPYSARINLTYAF